MKYVLACLLLLFMWNVEASSRSPTPDMQDEEESAAVVEVTGVNHDEKGDTVIDIGGMGGTTDSSLAVHYPAFGDIANISGGGVDWMNERAADIFKNLTEDQQREIITSALRGDFLPSSILLSFWKWVAWLSDPVCNLARVAVVVLPLLASSEYYVTTDSEHSEAYSYGSFAAKMGIATSVAGVISLTFDKICGYANDKIANQEKVAICLQAMMAAQNTKKDK